MRNAIDAFWRAGAYCLHPRVIWLSLLPLLVAVVLMVGLGYLFWEPAVDAVRVSLDGWSISQSVLGWLDALGASHFRAVVAPLIVVMLAVPLVVLISLLLVATLMTPSLVRLVVSRRFPGLAWVEGSWASSLAWSLGATALALFMLIVSLPLWLIPPVALVLPPLIWGWLTYRVMSFDALVGHATAQERSTLLREHRTPLLIMGVVCGYLGAAPAGLWALSALTIVLAPFLVAVSVWVYTLVFAFSSLWFTHYLLAALLQLRAQNAAAQRPASEPPAPLELDAPPPG